MEFCVFTEPQMGASYDTQLAFAREAERTGFDGYFRSDHYLTLDGDGLPGPTDAWTTLAGLARETSTIRLGTLVSSVTYRWPGILAIQVAQVDAMSGGRVELGLGTGWFQAEHEAYAIPFPAKRFGLLEEQLEIVQGLWATPVGERYSFEGEHYRLVDAPALPKPVQDRVPVIVGGGGTKRTPELAARFATEFNAVFASEEEIGARFARVREACERDGRDPATLKLSAGLTTVAGATEADLARRAEAIGTDAETFAAGTGFFGDAPGIAEKVERLKALGATRIYFQLLDLSDLDHIAYLGEEVLPLVR